MRASRPTAARKAAAVPVWPQTQNLFVGAGFIPPGEPCAAAGCGGMRASRPTDARVGCGCPVSRVMFGRFVGEGHAPPAGPCRTANIPGTMRASSPTGVCCNAGPQHPGWPRHSPSSVGADSISARGCLRRRRVRRDEAIPPYGRPVGCGCPVSRVMFGRFVGAGFTAPAGAFRRPTAAQRRLLGRRSRPGPCGDAGFPGRCEHRPLQGFVVMRGRSFPVGRRIAAVRRGPRPKNKIPQTSRRAVFQSRPPGRAPHLNSEL